MALIQQKELDFLSKEFAQKLVSEVKIVVFTQEMPCASCRETVELAQELARISPKIRVEIYDYVKDQMKVKEFRIDKIPAMVVMGSKDYGIRFYGVPIGYEFTSLIGAITDASKGESGLSQKTKDLLRTIDQSVHIQVFVTPTCPFCSAAVRLAHKLAIESDMIWSDMIEANEFVTLAQKYGVMSVPKIVINERFEVGGAVPEDLLMGHIMNALSQQTPQTR